MRRTRRLRLRFSVTLALALPACAVCPLISPGFAQEVSVLPKGTLEKGGHALVDADDVRIRSGPSLAHRILGLVQSGDTALVLERGSLETIGGMKSSWYRVRMEESGLEGWVFGWFLRPQPGGSSSGPLLQAGDRATVTADEVRLRSGPSLEHRILGSVDTGTAVSVLERSAELQTIARASSHWYRVRVDGGREGWLFGGFLEKRKTVEIASSGTDSGAVPGAGTNAPDTGGSEAGSAQALEPRLLEEGGGRFAEMGIIDQTGSMAASGDLDRNGRQEIIFLDCDTRGRMTLNAYEARGEGFDRTWSAPMGGREVRALSVLEAGSGELFLAARTDVISTLYRFDEQRGRLLPVRRMDSPLLAMGRLDGSSDYLVHVRRDRGQENDGTVTFTVSASRVLIERGRMRVLETFTYPYRLPVKKMIAFDLNDDGRDEIVCEIGGTDRGGGLVVLALHGGSLERIENTGVLTYEDRPFEGMWGASIDGQPRLVLYTSDPDNSSDVTAETGFLSAALDEEGLRLCSFRQAGQLLQDANNRRTVIPYTDAGGQLPFVLLDYTDGSCRVMEPM